MRRAIMFLAIVSMVVLALACTSPPPTEVAIPPTAPEVQPTNTPMPTKVSESEVADTIRDLISCLNDHPNRTVLLEKLFEDNEQAIQRFESGVSVLRFGVNVTPDSVLVELMTKVYGAIQHDDFTLAEVATWVTRFLDVADCP